MSHNTLTQKADNEAQILGFLFKGDDKDGEDDVAFGSRDAASMEVLGKLLGQRLRQSFVKREGGGL